MGQIPAEPIEERLEIVSGQNALRSAARAILLDVGIAPPAE
jgi:hypothetical protein